MHKKSTFNKTNFALQAMANLDLIACKFFDLLQWKMEDNYDKLSYKLKTTCLQEMGGCKMSKINIKHSLRKLLSTEIILENSKYAGFKARNFIYALDIEDSYIEVKVDDQLKDKLNINKSKDGYNQHNLSILKLFKGKHGYKLYQYIMMRLNTSKSSNIAVTIEDLRAFLGCKSSHKEFKYFNLKVLKVAVNEINLISDLNIEYEINVRNFLEIDFVVKKRKLSKITEAVQTQASTSIKIPQIEIKEQIIETAKPIIPPNTNLGTMSHFPEPVRDLVIWGYKDDTELMRRWHLSEEYKREIGHIWQACKTSYIDKGKTVSHNLIQSFLDKGTFRDKPVVQNVNPYANFETPKQITDRENAERALSLKEADKTDKFLHEQWADLSNSLKTALLKKIKEDTCFPRIKPIIEAILLSGDLNLQQMLVNLHLRAEIINMFKIYERAA